MLAQSAEAIRISSCFTAGACSRKLADSSSVVLSANACIYADSMKISI
jgi:hypothetical protein